MIKPAVGRIVLYRPKDPGYDDDIRHGAMIAHVIDDETVNLMVGNEFGVPFSEQHVKLIHDPIVQPQPGQCEWMPYQHGQAAKYDTGLDEVMRKLEALQEAVFGVDVALGDLPEIAAQNDQTNMINTAAEVLMGTDDGVPKGEGNEASEA